MQEYNSANIANRIKSILKANKTPANKMLVECGLNKNILYTMKSEGFLPRLEAIAKIADYLDVSIDYLMCRTDNPDINK